MKNKTFELILWLLLIVVTAVLGGVFVMFGMDWYSALNLPSMWPPNFIFSVVWTLIYGLMGLYFVLGLKKQTITKTTKVLTFLNLIVNILWSLSFFTFNQIFLGLVVIVINLVLAVMWVINVFKQSKVFGYLFLIYIAWLTIATTLNIAIWILN